MHIENISKIDDMISYLESKIFKFKVRNLDENLEYINVEQKDYGVCLKSNDYIILDIPTQYNGKRSNCKMIIGDCDIKVIFKSELYLGEYILLIDEIISDFKNETFKSKIEIEDLDLVVNAAMSIV